MATRFDGGAVRRRRWHPAVWAAAAALLSLPAIAMRFTDAVRWTGSDFAVMGALLFGGCAAFELLMRTSDHRAYRAGAAVAVGTGVLIVGSNLAVGIIGSENAPYNLVFFGIVLLALVGGASVRFRAGAVSRVLYTIAGAHALATAVGATQDVRGALLSTVFVGLWLLAATLFALARRSETAARGR